MKIVIELDLDWPGTKPFDVREVEQRLTVHANAVLLPPLRPVSAKLRSVVGEDGRPVSLTSA